MRRFVALIAGIAACAKPVTDEVVDTDETDAAPTSVYDDDAMWACLPGKADDVCARDLSATNIAPDGTRSTITPPRAEDPAFDCFYVYPTVDLLSGGLDTDFSEPGAKLDPLLNQAAPFTSLCNVYAPYYRQVALNAFTVPGLFETAYGDVADAFAQFLAQRSQDRPFAIVGHSQGTAHLVRLLQEEIETEPALADRLVVAVLLGGRIEVPEGEVVGGTFASTPLCTEPGQRGCVIAWDTYAAEVTVGTDDLFGFASEGHVNACTDPVKLAGHAGPRVSASWFATVAYGGAFTHPSNPYADESTAFVRIADRFDAACVSEGGATYLAVSDMPPEGDVREEPPRRNVLQEAIGFGMHALDYNIVIEDLLDAVGGIAVE